MQEIEKVVMYGNKYMYENWQNYAYNLSVYHWRIYTLIYSPLRPTCTAPLINNDAKQQNIVIPLPTRSKLFSRADLISISQRLHQISAEFFNGHIPKRGEEKNSISL
jgi:hypothetical protein